MIQKVIRCDSRNVGHIRYECLACPSYTRLFSCKSRLCNKCGKQYTDDWSRKQQELIFNVPHRHETIDLFRAFVINSGMPLILRFSIKQF